MLYVEVYVESGVYVPEKSRKRAAKEQAEVAGSESKYIYMFIE